jgi:GT2 family glycosyltransferase
MHKTTPQVSIIIPTYNRCASLRRTLDGLSNQLFPPEKIEVLVVIDGGSDETEAMLRQYKAPYTLHTLRQSNQGAAAARNYGAATANGWLLIFIDDDVEPTPALIVAHVRAHQAQPGRIVLGPYFPVLDGKVSFILTELRTWWENKFDAMRHPCHRFTYRDMLSGNFSIETKMFHDIGGFDTKFLDCGGEDYELGARLIKAGITIAYEHEAAGYHYEKSDVNRSFRRARQEGRADTLMSCRHPELWSTLPMKELWNSPYLPEQLLRKLAFRSSAVGDTFIKTLQHVLPLLEHLRLRRSWRLYCGTLRHYWYWRGVVDEMKSNFKTVELLVQQAASATENESPLEIDLKDGIEFAEQQLDSKRPLSVQVRYGQYYIGTIDEQPGAERLRGVHLRAILATDLAGPLLRVLDCEQVISLNPGISAPVYMQNKTLLNLDVLETQEFATS